MAGCGATCGINRERERQKDSARALVLRAYPGGWSEVPTWTPGVSSFGPDEAEGFARAFSESLPCQARVVLGARADWVYLVAAMEPMSWLATREDGVPPPARSSDVGLRVGLSALGRYGTLQEVRFTGAAESGGWWVEESRSAGVEDRRLQLFVKAVQGILRRDRVIALDAAFLGEPLADRDRRAINRLGVAPTLWTALFDQDAAVTRVGTFATDLQVATD